MYSLFRPWFEGLVVVGIGAGAFLLGRWCSRLPKAYWMLGYFLPLSLLLLYCLALFNPRIDLGAIWWLAFWARALAASTKEHFQSVGEQRQMIVLRKLTGAGGVLLQRKKLAAG